MDRASGALGRLAFSAVALVAFAGQAHAADSVCDVLDEARLFNVFVTGDFTNFSDVEGKVASGGLAHLRQFSLGGVDFGGDALVAGEIDAFQGSIYGNAIYDTSATVDQVGFIGGTLQQGAPIDFAAAGVALQSTSALLAGLPANAVAVSQTYLGLTQLYLTGGDPAFNVFDLDAADLTNVALIQVVAPPGSTVVVNVSGTTVSLFNAGIDLIGVDQHDVLWNLHEATSFTTEGVGWEGSVLAPYADVSLGFGNLDGSLFAKSATGPGQWHFYLFEGELPCDIPECGDGVVEGLEGCDDGNLIDGDGCSSVCTEEPVCLGVGTTETYVATEYAQGGGHGIWLNATPTGVQRLWLEDSWFTVDAGTEDGHLFGSAYTATNPSETWTFTADLTYRGQGVAGQGTGGPKKEKPGIQPTSITDTWRYWDMTGGELYNEVTGETWVLVQRPAGSVYPMQVGDAANNKDAAFGASMWFTWFRYSGATLLGQGPGDFNITFSLADECACGDALLSEGEACDDGNPIPGDGCDACIVEECGDGRTQSWLGEECDDGNDTAEDGCNACVLEYAGDGILQPGLGEECDDGNFDAGDGCFEGLIEPFCAPAGASESYRVRQYANNGHAIVFAQTPTGAQRLFMNDAWFTVDADDDEAHYFGTAYTKGNPADTWTFSMDFTYRGLGPAGEGTGGPKIERPALQPTSVSDTWRYWDMVQAVVVNDATGEEWVLEQMPAKSKFPLQVGNAANNKDAAFGASSWFWWDRYSPGGTHLGRGKGDINVSFDLVFECACGDGLVTEGEVCDDGNLIDGDGCDSTCQSETVCIDGLGPANDYNLFAFGDVTGLPDFEGKVAAGGDVELQNFSVAFKNPGGDALVAGNAQLKQGQVYGSTAYAGTYSAANVTNLGGTAYQGTPIDFVAAETELQDLSATVGALPVTGTTTSQYGGLTFTGSDPSLNVFQVSGALLGSSHSVVIDAPAGSTIVINVSGTSITAGNMGITFQGGANRQDVLWNFPDATFLRLVSVSWQGSVLAPYADFVIDWGNIDGSVVAASATGTGQHHWWPWLGVICP